MSLLGTAIEAGTAAAVHAVADADPAPPAPSSERTPAAPARPLPLPGRFELRTASATLADGVDVAVPFEAFTSGRFGVTRLLLSTAADPRRQTLSLALRTARRTVLETASVHALQRLFSRPLAAPFLVPTNDVLTATVAAAGAEGAGLLRIGAQGLSAEQLDVVADRLPSPEVILLARRVTVPAGATTFGVRFESRGVDLAVRRIAASTVDPAQDHAIGLTLNGRQGTELAELSPAQLDELFRDSAATPPIPFASGFATTVSVDNPTETDAVLSIVVEAYPVDA